MKRFQNIRGVLCDLDGVLYIGEQAIEGAVEAINILQERQIPHRYVTNTTTQSREALSQKLQRLGFPIKADEILSAPAAACVYLRQRQARACYFAVSEAIRDEFSEFPSADNGAEVVVIGDIGRAWSYDLMNHLFQMIMDGAELVAMHKGKYWQTLEGLRLDIGAFIAGLEYATGTTATLVGKPSPAFFQAAAYELGCSTDDIVMIGDDIESDVGGAQQSGIRGILVKTGKYREEVAAASSVVPDDTFDSIAQFVEHI